MPLFEYTCRECGHTFEALVMSGRQPECTRCGSSALDKLFSTFGTRSSGGATAASPVRSRFT